MKKILFCIIIGIIFVSCQDDDILTVDNMNTNEGNTTPAIIDGMLTIKLRQEMLESINNQDNNLTIPTGNSTLDDYLKSIGAYRLKRVFPYAGKDEDIQMSEGLNAWYTVWYNEPEHRTKSSVFYKSNDIFDFIEPVYEPVIEDYEITIPKGQLQTKTTRLGFNDPLFTRQWNLLNNGTIGTSISRADINIIPAWAEETGRPEVVVAIVDGGIDIHHEDLTDNLWVNIGEIPNNGIDDDNNGYIDDVYGFNFVNETGTISPHDHGTHVSGVIAAKNNNGKGISSIAGGNGTANSGVRLMSCQIFMNNPDYDPKDPNSRPNLSTRNSNLTAAAIVYGANNGAVICQNSWGYEPGVSTPQVIKDAINYFIKKAHSSVMQGGTVIFAASNDGTSFKTYPAAEKEVVSVAAYAPDFAASYYTNYGDWVNITAPGGSAPLDGKYPYENGVATSCIYSTITSSQGASRYGYMQGTSMACPHVSGVAALIVSKYGNSSFTANELKRRLITGVKAVNTNDYNPEKYKDKLGSGFLDASVAIASYDNEFVPDAPIFADKQIIGDYTSITLAWKAPEGTIDGSIQSYVIYYSDHKITTSNYSDSDIKKFEIAANYTKADDVLIRVVNNLKSGKNYYFAIQAFARNGNASALAIHGSGVSTLVNMPPAITSNIDLTHLSPLAGNDILEIIFNITDTENHSWNYVITSKEQLFIERLENILRIRIFANKFIPGIHPFELKVTDEYGASSFVNFNVNIIKDYPPRLTNNGVSVNVKIGNIKTISLSDFIEDEDKASLNFTLGQLNNENALVSLLNDQLTIKPKKIGQSELSISVTDKHNQSTNLKLPIFIYKNEGIYSLYPTIADKTLYVKLGNVIDGDIQLRIRNIMGKMALNKTYNSKEIDTQKRTLLINVTSLLPGKYELSIINNGKTYTESFVKQ